MMDQPDLASLPPLLVYLHANKGKDRAWCESLQTQLSIPQGEGKLRQWHRDLTPAGVSVKAYFWEKLAQAAAIVMLVSPDLYHDEYFRHFQDWQEYAPPTSKPQLLPVLLRPTTDWKSFVGELQVFPRNEKPLSQWQDKETACWKVAQEILLSIQQPLHPYLSAKKELPVIQQTPRSPISDASTVGNQEGTIITLPTSGQAHIFQRLQSYTVRLHIAQHGHWGSGFFVAPGYILTCAHVVQKAREEKLPVSVKWQGNRHSTARVVQATSAAYPNLALLKLTEQPEHASCILSTDTGLQDPLYALHIPGPSQDASKERLCKFIYEGVSNQPESLLTLSGDEVPGGLSGAPLFNPRTGAVCGVIDRTRSKNRQAGGRAIPIKHALEQFPEIGKLG